MTWSAYKTGVTLIAGTSLNALADGSWATGATVDNSSDRDELMDIAIRLNSAVTPVGDSNRIDVYLLPEADPDGSVVIVTSRADVSADTPPQYKVGEIAGMVVASGFQRGVLAGVVIPPGNFQIQIENNLGVALPSVDTNACEGFKYGPA